MPEPDTIPVSASVASTGKGIRYIGDYAYAYSGNYEANTTVIEGIIDFTSGAGVIVALFQLNGAISPTVADNRTASSATIKFNGETVAILGAGNGAIDAPMSDENKLIIPPFTNVQIDLDAAAIDAGMFSSVNIVGRVYGDK